MGVKASVPSFFLFLLAWVMGEVERRRTRWLQTIWEKFLRFSQDSFYIPHRREGGYSFSFLPFYIPPWTKYTLDRAER